MTSDALFEDIHWLLLIATNVIATDVTSEAASIPPEILQYEKHVQETCRLDVAANVEFLLGFGRNKSENDGIRIFFLLLILVSLLLYRPSEEHNTFEQNFCISLSNNS